MTGTSRRVSGWSVMTVLVAVNHHAGAFNRPRPGTLVTGTAPVIYEAAFRYAG